MKEHTTNKTDSNWDKHTSKQKSPSNNKKYTSGKMSTEKHPTTPSKPKNPKPGDDK